MQISSNGHGGARNGAGRKSKEEQIALLEKLRPMDELAFEVMHELLEKRNESALKLFMAYRFGQPKQTIDQTTSGPQVVVLRPATEYEPN